MPYLEAPIHVAGQTDYEAEQSIVKAYRDANLIEHANVSVTVLEARGRDFWIAGAIVRPGQYPILRSDMRLLKAVSMAGGTTTEKIDSVRVLRSDSSGRQVRTIDVPPAAFVSGDTSVNLVIHPNDQIVINGKIEPPTPHVVRLLVGADSLVVDGHSVNWPELERILSSLPDREKTVLQIAPTSPDITVGRFLEAQRRAQELVDKLRLQNLQPMMGEPGH